MKRRYIWVLVLLVLLFLPFACQAACVSPPANMTGWWSGDGNADDLAGSNHGTLMNGTTYATGMVDQAFSFDGLDDYVNVPDDPSLRAISEFSIDFWVNFNQLPRTGNYSDSLVICEKLNDYLLYWRADQQYLEMVFTSAGTGLYHIGANIPLGNIVGQWHHFAITSRNPVGSSTAEFHFYMDGAEQANTPSVNPPQVPTGWFTGVTDELNIGRRPTNEYGYMYFDGMIDELEIFDRVLLQSEVQAIFDAGSDGKCKDNAIPTLSEWGQILLALMLGVSALWISRKRLRMV